MSFKLVFVSAVFVALSVIYFDFTFIEPYIQKLYPNFKKSQTTQTNLFSIDELKLYNGIDRPNLYLSILGQVFDVTKGSAYYAPGKTYNFFIGRDGSRSFVTGQFNDENEFSDQVADLKPEDLLSLNHWVQFYKKEYKRVGKLIGRYYQENGDLTQYGKEVRKLIKKAEKARKEIDTEKIKYPPCNVEWDSVQGSRVWCTNKSGGVDRDWVGVPRKFFEPGSKNFRCACINSDLEDSANLKQYEGCDSKSESCFVKS